MLLMFDSWPKRRWKPTAQVSTNKLPPALRGVVVVWPNYILLERVSSSVDFEQLMIPAVLEDRRLKTSLTRAFWACFCPCFSRIHSSYRDYTKPLFIAQHKLKLIFVFQDVSGRANDAAEKSTFYWSFPKEERNGVQVYEYRYVTWISFDIRMGMSQNPSLQKSMKKKLTEVNEFILLKKTSLILKPPGVVLFIFMGQFSPMKFRGTNPSSFALPVEARWKKSKEDGFFS